MELDRFLQEVKQRACLQTDEQAVRAIRAVIETLGECLGNQDQQELQSQLPRVMRGWVHQCPNGKRLLLEHFYDRVGCRSGMIYPRAYTASRAVLGLLSQELSAAALDRLLAGLPGGYRRAFDPVPPLPADVQADGLARRTAPRDAENAPVCSGRRGTARL